MSTVSTVKAQLQNLIDSANGATGNTDNNLTDAVNALVAGYGNSGGYDISNMYKIQQLQFNGIVDSDSLTIEKVE